MNTTEFKRNIEEDYGTHYTKAEVLTCLEALIPVQVFDMVCESGLSFMDDIREHIACWMMDLQKKAPPLGAWEEHGDVLFVLVFGVGGGR